MLVVIPFTVGLAVGLCVGVRHGAQHPESWTSLAENVNSMAKWLQHSAQEQVSNLKAKRAKEKEEEEEVKHDPIVPETGTDIG